tara:strand:+ start:930 stop:1202 length:273 start_codon:yes stop_codon:yes gene_type:complete
MSLGKKDIAKNISSEAQISYKNSYLLLESFISIIKNNSNKNIKIPRFGVFYNHTTPSRIGRNPLTKDEYKIPSFKKLAFRASKEAKNIYN